MFFQIEFASPVASAVPNSGRTKGERTQNITNSIHYLVCFYCIYCTMRKPKQRATLDSAMSGSNDIVHDDKTRSQVESTESHSSLAIASKRICGLPSNDEGPIDRKRDTFRNRYFLQLNSRILSRWNSSLDDDTRSKRKVQVCHRNKISSQDENGVISPNALSVLPHSTLIDILAFCDSSTLLAIRGVSKIFCNQEIPREFNRRAMAKLKVVAGVNEARRRKNRQNQSIPAFIQDDHRVLSSSRYSYKKRVVDDELRKVWIFVKNNDEGNVNKLASKIPFCNSNPTGTSRSSPDTDDSHQHHWSLQAVASKVLRMIQDMEFYNGVVYGYDEDKAKELLLQKGCIDENDFPQPKWRNRFSSKFLRHSEGEYFPFYGKWRAEASVRSVSLNEALEIISSNSCGFKRQQRWGKYFPILNRNNRKNPQIRGSSLMDESGLDLGLSLLLAASGKRCPLPLEDSNNSIEKSFHSRAGICLAEYSTVFENTKMSCSVLLIRTLGGAEAEIRVLSGAVEAPDSLSMSRHSNISLATS